MLTLDVALDLGVYHALERVAHSATGGRLDRPAALAEAVAAVVTRHPAFGAEAPHLARAPAEWFALDRMADPGFWVGQEVLREHIATHLTESVEAVVPFLPRAPAPRVVPVVVHPVPGLTTCFGTAGGQLFGLYEGADPRELLLFLSHTYYHELSGTLGTTAARAAEADPSTAEAFRRYLQLLVRHEGIANYAVLGPLRRLRAEGTQFRYFRYAALVDNREATARAMAACRQLLAMLDHDDQETVTRVSRRVNTVLKNPRLPVINLIGIHLAEAIAAYHGERVLLDVDQREPEEFFALYADTDDPLREELLGPTPHATPAGARG